MSADLYSHVVEGLIIPNRTFYNLFYRQEKIKAFEHSFQEDWIVDPKTGRALYTKKEVAVDGLSLRTDRFKEHEIFRIGADGGICIGRSFSSEMCGHDQYHILSDLKLDEEYKNRLKEDVKDLNVWDEKMYGICFLAYISY